MCGVCVYVFVCAWVWVCAWVGGCECECVVVCINFVCVSW